MDNLKLRGLQNQTARPNASNPGLDTTLQSQIRDLNTQQVEMVRSKDPFWNYTEDRADGSMKCKFCPHTFANKTSISRIKWHLSGEEGHNVAICRGVTKEVQEAAFLAMRGRNKRLKNTESSINVNDSGISTCPHDQNIRIENMGGGIGRVQREVQVVEPGVGEERISSHAIAGNDEVSSNSEDDLQVRGLQNQTATPNASNPGLETSLQSQIRGLNIQQVEMVRSKDPFWNYTEDRADGSMKCKFCPHTFANKTSISRIKWHLSGEEGHNVATCSGVTKEVQEAAFLAMCGGNKRHRSTESSINVNDCGISTCPQEQNIEISMGGCFGRVKREVQVVEPGVGEERISSHAIARNDEVSSKSEDDLQVKGLQNRTATPNASNPGLETSLQSQIRGLNTQQVEMVASKDPFWNYIEDRADGSVKCKFCQCTWANKISISRFKWHLSGERRHGVAICSGVAKEVQEAASKAMNDVSKRHKITESSINIINYCGISTCPEEQNIEINMGGGIGRVQREVQVVEPRVGGERISSHAIARNDEVSMTGMIAHEDRVSKEALKSRQRTEPVDLALEQSNAILGNLAGGAGRIQVGVQGMEQGPREERIQSHLQVENGIENTGEGSFQHDAFETLPRIEHVQLLEPRGDSSQFCLDIGRRYDQPCASSVNNEVTMNDEQDMVRVKEEEDVENSGRSVVQAGAGARSSESLKFNNTRGVPLPTSSTKPVGQAFKENTKVIWSLLMDNEVSTIGIYGMGGVGKTTILQHIHNKLLHRLDFCDHVWWVTVSQDFSINRLQSLIAKHLDLDLSREVDDLHRAAKLSKELMKKQKWILILDDLWNNFELQEVGIPVPLKGCKLIMTTRSETVCHRMACHHKIKVKPLSGGEAWTLFMEKLGRDIALSPEVEGIAKAIARECAGLPLGIITVAGSLRGVDDLHEWRNTLKKLRESEFRDMDEKVFQVLRVSYNRLGDVALQQCLLYCALFPEDQEIKRERLIGYLIDEGIIKGRRSRGDAFDEGHTMLNRLEYACLLESAQMTYVKMHGLIRDMAIHILLENSQVMVKAGVQLKELPDAEEWTENLTRVSLMQNQIKAIPLGYSPRCPYLSTLLLCQNRWLGFIADSFFKQLHGLKVLDLSCTGIRNLPDSVSDLVSLTALLLNDCWKLRHVPSLKKLRELRRLDLSCTTLEKMPQGMKCLTNLRYLRMNGCGEMEFPSGVIPKFSHLQVFVLEEIFNDCYAPITVKGKEVGSLRNLETLECHFEGLSDFVEYLRSRDGILSLSTYRILVGIVDKCYWAYIDDFPSKTVVLGNFSINRDRDFQVKFLNGIQGLVCQCIDVRSLCDVLSLENATELEDIRIWDCNSMESLVSSSWLPSYNGLFCKLKQFYCGHSSSMKKLFPVELLSNLVNLERIDVMHCEKMEEIIGTTDEESSTSNSITEVTLPKLRILELSELPELKSICRAKLICNSLETIVVINCEKLKRMPICLPLLENGKPSPPPSLKIYIEPEEWWESVVEWEHPNAKDVEH